MKTYKDVFISFNNIEELKNYIKDITNSMIVPWQRSYDREQDAKSFVSEDVYCFERNEDSKLPSCGLTIFFKDQKTLYIPNVVPKESGWLTVEEYNGLITEFYDIYLLPLSGKNNIDVTITNDDLQDEDILNKPVAECLRRFSTLANMSTGSSHPCDRNRWYEFIYLAFDLSKKKTINTDLLQKILIEQGWGEDRASDLVSEYEFGLGLLEYLDEQHSIR